VIEDYFAKKLNRLIVDYLLRENYFRTAQNFIAATGMKVNSRGLMMKDFVDLDIFVETNQIIEKIKGGSCAEALSWCNTHKTKLQKTNVSFRCHFLLEPT